MFIYQASNHSAVIATVNIVCVRRTNQNFNKQGLIDMKKEFFINHFLAQWAWAFASYLVVLINVQF